MPKQLSDTIPYPPTAILVGPSGSGKSSFAYRFPRPYVINADMNMAGPAKTLRAEGRPLNVAFDDLHVDDKGVPVPPLQRYQRFAAVLSAAIKSPDYDTIILDSLTTLIPVFQNEVRRQKNKPEGSQFEIQEWGQFGFLWTNCINMLRTCGKTVLLIGHLQVERDQMAQALRYVLAMPGQTGDILPALVTDVWLFEVRQSIVGGVTKDSYWVRTTQTFQNPNCKTSLVLPREFEATQAVVDDIVRQITTPAASVPTKP